MSEKKQKTILLVEDEIILAISGKRTLEKFGYNVVTVNTGEKAIEICKVNNSIDLIIMDIDLGAGLDGTETAIELLKEHAIPIVFLSSHTEPEIVEKTEKITSYGYVVKNSGDTVLGASIKMAFKLFDAHKKVENELTEHKRTEVALRESERTLQEAQHIAHIGSWQWTIATDTVNWSKELYNITGLDPNLPAPSYARMSSIYMPESWSRLSVAVAKALQFKEPYGLDLDIVRPDKSERHVFVRGEADYDANGNVAGLHGTVQDLTENKHSEITFNNKLLILASNIEGYIAYVNADTLQYELVNDAFANAFGIPEEKIIGRHIKDIIGEKNFQFALKYIDEVKEGKSVSCESSFEAGSEMRWIQVNCSPVTNADGQVTSIAVVSYDITERKQTGDALQKNISRLELAMNVADMAWWEMELPSGNVAFGKRKAEILGFPPEKFKHYKDFTDLVHPDDYERIMEAMRGHLRGTLNRYETEYRILTKDNKYRWFYDIGSIVEGGAMEWQNGMPVKITGLVFDISERKAAQLELLRLNEELQTSKASVEETLFEKNMIVEELIATKEKLENLNSEKDKLFSIIAHDLRSPFQGFIGLTESMVQDINSFSTDDLSDIGRLLYNSSKNLFTLLNNLLEWSRMQQGMVSFNPIKISLSEIVSQNIDLLVKVGEKKGIEIIHNIDINQTVYADEAMFNSILRNFLSNAIKFTRQGGKVTVSSKKTGNNMVEISVTDSGIGMSKDLSVKLFKTDEKTGRKGTDGELSTGLGLLLCKEFIEKHGGQIWVESEEEKGSSFRFILQETEKITD
ncbi:MAG: PAS domain-containing protein [Ignavibacteria bacterium]